jgi:hypothetical protein
VGGDQVLRHGGEGATQLVCGFLQCDELRFHPILRHLPGIIHVSPSTAPGGEWLAGTIRHTAHEACQARPGARCVVPLLTELLFVEILRTHMQSLSSDEVGWFAALNDPVVGAALKCMHAAPLAPWDVDGWRAASASRAAFWPAVSGTFRTAAHAVLTHWRLQLARKPSRNRCFP